MAPQFLSLLFTLFCFHSRITLAHLFQSSNNTSPSLGFLNRLSRVEKGDNAIGLRELKKHLSYLGYLNYNTQSNNQIHADDNIFDDFLESALRKYQEFYGLNVTGVLDTDTIVNLQKPRCGLPDFYDPDKNSTPFHMTSHYSFFPGRPKWRKRALKYAFNRNVKEAAKSPLERALSEWASKTPFKFFRVSDITQGDIRISFMRGYHGDGHPFGGPDAGLAHTFAPPDGRVHFDSDQKWATNGDKNAYDIQTVGLHELGHALGLGHSRLKEAIMYATVDPGERKGLHGDDIKGIMALYNFKRVKPY